VLRGVGLASDCPRIAPEGTRGSMKGSETVDFTGDPDRI
jgi:hypothetical protein